MDRISVQAAQQAVRKSFKLSPLVLIKFEYEPSYRPYWYINSSNINSSTALTGLVTGHLIQLADLVTD